MGESVFAPPVSGEVQSVVPVLAFAAVSDGPPRRRLADRLDAWVLAGVGSPELRVDLMHASLMLCEQRLALDELRGVLAEITRAADLSPDEALAAIRDVLAR